MVALEKRIAFTVFAIGVVLVLLALASCGGESDQPDVRAVDVERCSPQNSTLPVLAIEAGDEEGSLRVVAPGEACGFAVDSYKGTLYVELRKRSDDPTDYADLRCYDITPKSPVDEAFRTNAISPGRSAQANQAEVASLLDSDGCAAPSQREPSFILD